MSSNWYYNKGSKFDPIYQRNKKFFINNYEVVDYMKVQQEKQYKQFLPWKYKKKHKKYPSGKIKIRTGHLNGLIVPINVLKQKIPIWIG